ncbi:MAG: hypothetical protein AMXMBFR33_25970 [Candidatus Xenobia bacterium]
MKPRYVTEEEVDRVVSARPLTDALEQAFRALATGQARQAPRLRVTSPPHVLHNLPAIALGRAGIKTYLSGPQGVTMVTVVFELESGRLEAIIECNRLSQLRTGCATALATRYLAEPGPQRLALLGAGTVARGQLEALAAEQELAEVRLFSPRPQSRDDFVGWARERLSLEVRACASPTEALEGANLVVTATSSGKPLVQEAMLAPKCHLNAVGANRAGRRELASEVVLSSQLTVVDDLEQARIEAGDLLEVAGLDWGPLVPLASLVANPPTQRPSRTLFKSLGVALEDLAAAAYVLQLL